MISFLYVVFLNELYNSLLCKPANLLPNLFLNKSSSTMVRVIKGFESTLLDNVYINKYNIEADVVRFLAKIQHILHDDIPIWLIKAITLIDLTTLAGDDTRVNVTRLCAKAMNPISEEVLQKLKFTNTEGITTAAVCVYPSRVADAYAVLKKAGATDKVQIASVATGFPSGQYPLQTRVQEITYAKSQGATEIDVVLDRSLVLAGKWELVYEEVKQMREACGSVHLKVILGVGELGTLENVYKASMVSMMAGADFIKTSTGKEAVNATLPVGLVMCRAIRHYYRHTGIKVGLKPAGGIKTPTEAIQWLLLVYTELGPDWLNTALFRIGASSLLGTLEEALYKLAYPDDQDFGSVGNKFSFI